MLRSRPRKHCRKTATFYDRESAHRRLRGGGVMSAGHHRQDIGGRGHSPACVRASRSWSRETVSRSPALASAAAAAGENGMSSWGTGTKGPSVPDCIGSRSASKASSKALTLISEAPKLRARKPDFSRMSQAGGIGKDPGIIGQHLSKRRNRQLHAAGAEFRPLK